MKTHDRYSLVLRNDVAGAPGRVGQGVRISPTREEDSSADERFAGREGVVRGFVYDDARSQFPADPLVIVLVEGLGEDLFFPEELGLRSASRRTPAARAPEALSPVRSDLSSH